MAFATIRNTFRRWAGGLDMLAKDIMTRRVITVIADTPVTDIATLFLERHISAAPVVDENERMVGIVSEGDLVVRSDLGTDEHRHSWWLRLLNDNATLAGDYLKSHGKTAADVMSHNVVAVSEDTPVSEIARLMEQKHIKRVPVLDGDKIVGLVSRANIIRQIAAVKEVKVESYVDDDTIRKQTEEALRKEEWSSIGTTGITVNQGVVEFWGLIGSDAERNASRLAVESVAGVKKVVDHRQLRAARLVGYL
jgi:CBS domain-containing protein